MRKEKYSDKLSDEFFFENGYLKLGDENSIFGTNKWGNYIKDCFKRNETNTIVDGKKIRQIKLVDVDDLINGLMSDPIKIKRKGKGNYINGNNSTKRK